MFFNVISDGVRYPQVGETWTRLESSISLKWRKMPESRADSPPSAYTWCWAALFFCKPKNPGWNKELSFRFQALMLQGFHVLRIEMKTSISEHFAIPGIQ